MKVLGKANHDKPGIFIDRRSRWRNPYQIDEWTSRETVIERFEVYARDRLKKQPDWLDPLIGQDLKCHCKPLACHGDVILKLLREMGKI